MKMKAYILFLIMPFLIASACFPTPIVQAAGNATILTNTGYKDSSGNYRIVGEIQNNGNSAVNFVQVTATYYTSSNAVIDTRFDLTLTNVIMPGCKSPFEIALLDIPESAQVHHYTLKATFLETSPLPIGIEITSNSSHIDTSGSMHVIVQIKNIGTITVTDPRIVVTYYDASSKVVAAAKNILPAEELAVTPGQTVPFEISLSAERAPYVSTYALTAESNQYTIVPEYSALTILSLLATSTTLVLALSRKKKKQPILI